MYNNFSVNASIKSIGEIPIAQLNIPEYQRPYRWKTENVAQLLRDISDNKEKSEYRIGSIILHEKTSNTGEKTYDIVDGQQRLTTIMLILKVYNDKRYRAFHIRRHEDTEIHVKENYNFINQWQQKHPIKGFLDFLLNKCKVTWIVTTNLSEAFQMFDSQNGRGKELEAYNLLKAFHIRAIDETSSAIKITQAKIYLDRRWEKSTQFKNGIDLLKHVIEYLYRARIWARNEIAFTFNKTEIKEFKGISLKKGNLQPCHNLSVLLCKVMDNAEILLEPVKRTIDEIDKVSPYMTINMPIINGKYFFDYIDTYIEAYKHLFYNDKNDVLQGFRNCFKKYCLDYTGAYRDGDTYIRELYEILLIILYDKMGDTGVDAYYKNLYVFAYRFRLENKVVQYNMVANYPGNFINKLIHAYRNSEIEDLLNTSDVIGAIYCRKLGKNEADIAKFILRDCNVSLIADDDIDTGNNNSIVHSKSVTLDMLNKNKWNTYYE